MRCCGVVVGLPVPCGRHDYERKDTCCLAEAFVAVFIVSGKENDRRSCLTTLANDGYIKQKI